VIDLAVAVIVLEKPSFQPGQSSDSGQSNGKTRYDDMMTRFEHRIVYSSPVSKQTLGIYV
jgi:hypothetical protein